MIISGVCLFETESLQWGDYNYCNKDFFFFAQMDTVVLMRAPVPSCIFL